LLLKNDLLDVCGGSGGDPVLAYLYAFRSS
jgi:hypothetical protein